MRVSSSKGTLYNFSARFLFVLSSYLIHILLGRYLGPEKYGTFGIVTAIYSLWLIFLSNGFRQAISKYISEFRNLSAVIYRKGLFLQTIFSLFLTSLLFLGSQRIAFFLGDVNLGGYFRFSSLILPFSAIYFIGLGKLNGEKRFGREATVMSIYYLLKLTGITILVVILGWGISGAIGGMFLASAVISILTIILCPGRNRHGDFAVQKLIFFALPILSFFLAVNLLMNLDLIFVKRLLAQEAFTGFYTAAITIARTPYFLFYAFSATLLPTISHSFTKGNLSEARMYISKYLRYFLIFALPLTVLISAKAANLVVFVYGLKYENSGIPLSIIIFGMFFLSFFMLLATILFGIGKAKLALLIQSLLLPLDILLLYYFIPRFGLAGAALATTLAALAGVLFISFSVYRKLRVFLPLSSSIKIILANLIIFSLSECFSLHGFWLLFFFVISCLVYLLLLWLFKEIKREDWQLLKGIIA